MIFGDVEGFSIELEITDVIDEDYWGTINFKINGNVYGSSDITSIGDFFSFVPSVIKTAQMRENCELFLEDSATLYHRLRYSIFSGDDDVDEIPDAGIYIVKPPTHTFDGFFMFVISCGEIARVILSNQSPEIYEFHISRQSFEKAFLSLFTYLDGEFEKITDR